MSNNLRTGRYVTQPEGYSAFIPAPFPPDPPVRMDNKLSRLLSRADQALGRLDGVTWYLPNPDLFVGMYVRQEAVLSAQIEGTQSTLEDLLAYEQTGGRRKQRKDVEEIVNYVKAMNHGLDRLADFPLSLRLIKEIHGLLLQDVRGGHKQPGEFRASQNWIGAGGLTNLPEAAYVPAPVHEMKRALDDLEKFLHDDRSYPPLVRSGLAHAQFETIHPFLDGNGRMGRLLITFLLCRRGILSKPLLYLSHYLKAHRDEYYDRLTAIRNDDDWEGWIEFFLEGVRQVSDEAVRKAQAILGLREKHRDLIAGSATRSPNVIGLLDWLFEQPRFDIPAAARHLGCAYPTASNAVGKLEELGIVEEMTGQNRNRVYRYGPYIDLFKDAVGEPL